MVLVSNEPLCAEERTVGSRLNRQAGRLPHANIWLFRLKVPSELLFPRQHARSNSAAANDEKMPSETKGPKSCRQAGLPLRGQVLQLPVIPLVKEILP